MCHGRFHGILPIEYSGTFHELPWGLYKEMPTNIRGQSDIVTPSTYIWNKAYPFQEALFHQRFFTTSALFWKVCIIAKAKSIILSYTFVIMVYRLNNECNISVRRFVNGTILNSYLVRQTAKRLTEDIYSVTNNTQRNSKYNKIWELMW